jgi:hypothetical protein
MARTQTSRKDTSINALDDLDLDDMFEGEQNGLFDELGMDLGELGDIANEDMHSKATSKKQSQSTDGLDDMKFDLLGDIGVDDGATSHSPTTLDDDSSSPVIKKSKRKAKRKTRDMSPYDDDEYDDDGAAMKKRRYTKKARTTVPKKAKDDVGTSPPTSSPKTKKAKTALVPATVERSTSQGNIVAAAGQFGGRHKRATYPPLSRGTSKTKAKAITAAPQPPAPVVADPPKIERVVEQNLSQPLMLKRGRSQTEISMPIESLFCGLHSSDTIFYPFMATLPAEASMKRCSKQYSSLEKINASLTMTSPGPDLDDAIVKLLMLYDPVPTNDKKLVVSASVVATRKIVKAIDRQRLVSDLTSISTLVKRQHDFLAQSLENMERWCKHHFSESDYRAVYGGEKPKPILAQLTSPFVRVRIKCASVKESKLSALLIAHIPMPSTAKPLLLQPSASNNVNNISNLPLTGSSSMAPPTLSSGAIKKKRADAASSLVAVDDNNGGTAAAIKMAEETVVPYSELSTNARRELILDLIGRHALRLETQQTDVDEVRRKAFEKQNNGLQKVVDDDDLLAVNTMTLWKWVDKSCYLSEFSEQDIRSLLTYQPDIDDERVFWEETFPKKTVHPVNESLCERLQSLLVEVNTDSEDDDCEDENDGDEVDSLWDSPNGTTDTDGTLLDLRELTTEERAYILLRAAGLVDESRPPPENGDKIDNDDDVDDDNDNYLDDGPSVFEDLILRMKKDLSRVDCRNNSRTAFLESSARAYLEVTRLAKRQDERNSQMMARYNQLAKKQKETKRSARQKLPRKDEEWVPW